MTPFMRSFLIIMICCLLLNILTTHLITRQIWRNSKTKRVSQRKLFLLAMLPNIHLPPLRIRIEGDDAEDARLARTYATAVGVVTIGIAILSIFVVRL